MPRSRGPDDELLAGFVLGWAVALETLGIALENPNPHMDRAESILREIAEGRLTLRIPVDELVRQNPQMYPQFEAMLRDRSAAATAEEREGARRILTMIQPPRGRQ